MTTHCAPKTKNRDSRGGHWGKRHKTVTNRYLRQSARRHLHASGGGRIIPLIDMFSTQDR
jgi:hypothetical protein